MTKPLPRCEVKIVKTISTMNLKSRVRSQQRLASLKRSAKKTDAPMTKQDEAKQCMQDHRWNDAIPILRAAISDAPADPWNAMYLGSCYYELHDYAEALKWFENAEQIDGGSATAVGLQGDVYQAIGYTDRTRDLYQRALQIDPSDELAIKNWERFLSLEIGAERQWLINCLPAANGSLPKHFDINSVIGARPRQAVTALGRSRNRTGCNAGTW